MSEYQTQPTLLLSLAADPLLLRGVLDACPAAGWRAVNLAYMSNYIPSRQPPVGAIIANAPDDSTLAHMRNMGIPVVCSRTDQREELKCLPKVVQDRRAAGRLAAASFAERGFRNLGYVEYVEYAVKPGSSPLRSGFREGARDVDGCEVHLLFLESQKGEIDGAAFRHDAANISVWLESLPEPLGVPAYNHRMGARIIAACEMAGLHVPEQAKMKIRIRGAIEEA